MSIIQRYTRLRDSRKRQHFKLQLSRNISIIFSTMAMWRRMIFDGKTIWKANSFSNFVKYLAYRQSLFTIFKAKIFFNLLVMIFQCAKNSDFSLKWLFPVFNISAFFFTVVSLMMSAIRGRTLLDHLDALNFVIYFYIYRVHRIFWPGIKWQFCQSVHMIFKKNISWKKAMLVVNPYV